MAATLDLGLTGPVLTTGLPPISALRCMQGLVPQTGGLESLSHRFTKRQFQASFGEEGIHPEEVQEFLWQQFFSDQTQWWDNRRSNPTPRHPDFRHNKSKVALWLNNRHKPAWVDSQLAKWDAGLKRPPEPISTSQGAFGRLPVREDDLEVEMCRKLCEDGRITDAVDALNLLVERGCHVSTNLFYRVLRMCIAHKDLVLGRRIHALTSKSGYEGDAFLATHLMGLYASHGKLDEAMRVFTKVSTPSSYNWATVILAYARHGEAREAIRLYRQMLESTNVKPDNHIYVAVLKACAAAGNLAAGKEVHAHILASPEKPNIFVQNGLVSMYTNCGSLEDARTVFDRLPKRDVVTWNAILAGYAQKGMGQEALSLYSSMQQEHMAPPNPVTFACLLQACTSVGALHQGKQLHAQTEERGLQDDVVVGGSLVNMYAKCGSLEDARSVFDRLPDKNVVTWNAMLAGYAHQGMGREALTLYNAMQQERLIPPNSVTFLCLLQACASVGVGALHEGKQLHAQTKELGLQDNVLVGSSLVTMFSKCGSLEDARIVFDKLRARRNVVTWNAMIAGYAQQGMGQEALSLYNAMQQEGLIPPNSVTFVCLLQACASIGVGALHEGKQLHAQIQERGLQDDGVVGGSLVNMYAKCGSLEDAHRIFDKLPARRNVVTWNAMIAGYAQQGMGQEALSLYNTMQQEGITPADSVTFVCLLQACARIGVGALYQGKQLHAQIEEKELEGDVVVGSSLVNMYAKCGSLEYARSAFDRLPDKNVVMWTTMIAGYAQQGMGEEALSLYSGMQQEGLTPPDSVTFVCLLQACASVGVGALHQGKQIHAQIEERGLQDDVIVGGSVVNMYAKCGSSEEARIVFDRLPDKNVVTWTAMIAGYAQQGMGQEALTLYSSMQQEGITPADSVTFVCLLQACAGVGVAALHDGKQLHTQIEERGLQDDVVVGGSLINMYTKCGSLVDARIVFDRLPAKNVVTWTATIAGYAQQGMGEEALSLYSSMQQEGITPADSVTFVCLLQACASVGAGALHHGKQLHAQIEAQGLQDDVVVGGTLVNMYAKCGSLEDARNVFDRLPDRNMVTWTAMLAGYAQQGMGEEALSLYSSMQQEGITPADPVTFVCLLQACAIVAALPLGKQLHAQIEERGLQADVVVGAGLVNMYAKCGSMSDSQQVFDSLPERTIEAWNALAGGYTRQGDTEVVFALVDRMSLEGLQPDGITFLCVLTVCSHVGLVYRGRKYFEAMNTDYGISPTVEHYTCMIDLLGRAGHLDEALLMAKTMPFPPNSIVWLTLLGACQKWNNVEIGQQVFEFAVSVDGKDPASFALMSNIYASAEMWEEAKEMQARRVKSGAWKKPGQSWWTDMGGVVHTFVVGDRKHPDSDGLYATSSS